MPSTPFACSWATAWLTVVARFCRPAHMLGVPALKSCRMIVSTTFTPLGWAVLTRSVSWLEFQTAQPLSVWMMVPSVVTWRPNTATVESRSKFQLGKPRLGSARLLARAKPNTSRCGPPTAPPPPAADSAAAFRGARGAAPRNGVRFLAGALASASAAACMTTGCTSW